MKGFIIPKGWIIYVYMTETNHDNLFCNLFYVFYLKINLVKSILFCNLFYVFGIFKKYKENLKLLDISRKR